MEQVKGRIGQEFLIFNEPAERKIRWDFSYEQIPFELYVAQWRVPKPYPETIKMNVDTPFTRAVLITEEDVIKRPELAREPLHAELQHADTLTKTKRFNPAIYGYKGGPDYNKSGCGHINFPIGLLKKIGDPLTLAVSVDWE